MSATVPCHVNNVSMIYELDELGAEDDMREFIRNVWEDLDDLYMEVATSS